MASLAEISRRTGFSVSTVSEVLKQRPGYRDATRQCVLQAAKELGYRPNELARGLKRRRSGMIGLMIRSFALDAIATSKLVSLESRLQGSGLRMLTGLHRRDPRCEAQVINQFLASQVEGLILSPEFPDNTPLIEGLLAEGFPLVALDSTYEVPVPCVGVDRAHGTYLQVRHLLQDCGCQRLMLIYPGVTTGTGGAKERGVRQALEEAGSTPEDHLIINLAQLKCEGVVDVRDVAERVAPLLAECDGVAAQSDSLAVAVMSQAQRQGRQVPDDLKVVGFDDSELATTIPLRLTTIRQPTTLGAEAFDLLMEQIKGEWSSADRQPQVIHKPELVIRESTVTRPSPLLKESLP